MKPSLVKPRPVFLIHATLVIVIFAMTACGELPTPMQPSFTVTVGLQDGQGDASTATKELTSIPGDVPTATEGLGPESTEVLPPISARYKIKYFNCNDKEQVTSAAIDLDISGGKEPYTTFPDLPVFKAPEEFVSIFIESATDDGKPSGEIKFQVPPRSFFNCHSQSRESEYRPATTDPNSDPPCPEKPNGKSPKKCDKKDK